VACLEAIFVGDVRATEVSDVRFTTSEIDHYVEAGMAVDLDRSADSDTVDYVDAMRRVEAEAARSNIPLQVVSDA
jgi:hypothetical protein